MQTAAYGTYKAGQVILDESISAMDESRVVVVFLEKEPQNNKRAEFAQLVHEIQSDSLKNGTSEMTMDEINAEIALARKERLRKAV
jgi:hypothetical protein